MNAIIVIISDPFEPFKFDDECNCCILVVLFEPFEFDNRSWKISVFFADPFEPFEFDDECDRCILIVPFESFEFDDGFQSFHSNPLNSTMDEIIIFQFG